MPQISAIFAIYGNTTSIQDYNLFQLQIRELLIDRWKNILDLIEARADHNNSYARAKHHAQQQKQLLEKELQLLQRA